MNDNLHPESLGGAQEFCAEPKKKGLSKSDPALLEITKLV